MKNFTIAFLIIILLGAGVYFFTQRPSSDVDTVTDTTPLQNNEQTGEIPVVETNKEKTVIGKSVEGRDITAYHYGTGETEVVFVGGIHGGYSWNTVLVAYELMDYLKATPSIIPNNVKVTVIPVLNPDGLNKVVGTPDRFTKADVPSSQSLQISGRYNANKVDLSRNFDCNWKSVGTWRNTSVSGGKSVFSEPESLAVKSYMETNSPEAVVVWYSAAGGVYTSSCNDGILPQTTAITNIYAKASGFPAYESFDFYETTGDMVNWLAKNKIPAISVLLSTHTDTEWDKNRKGVEALLQSYAK